MRRDSVRLESGPWTPEDRAAPDVAVQRLAERITESSEHADLASAIARYRTFAVRGLPTEPVPADVADDARRLAVKLLAVGLFPDGRPEDVRFVQRALDVERSTLRPLVEVEQPPGPKGERYAIHRRGGDVPIESFETVLVHVFEGAGVLPMQRPFAATTRVVAASAFAEGHALLAKAAALRAEQPQRRHYEWLPVASSPLGKRATLALGRRGEIETAKVGRQVLVRIASLRAYIEAHRRAGHVEEDLFA